jgi:hypothetical protein
MDRWELSDIDGQRKRPNGTVTAAKFDEVFKKSRALFVD